MPMRRSRRAHEVRIGSVHVLPVVRTAHPGQNLTATAYGAGPIIPCMSDGLDRLLHSLGGVEGPKVVPNGTVRADTGREGRKGVPEVILADRKRPDDSLAAARAFLDARGRAILSRCPESLIAQLWAEHIDCQVEPFERSGMLVLKR